MGLKSFLNFFFIFGGLPASVFVVLVWTRFLNKGLPGIEFAGLILIASNLIDTIQSYYIIRSGQEFNRTLMWQVERFGLQKTLIIKAITGTLLGLPIFYLGMRTKVEPTSEPGVLLIWIVALWFCSAVLNNTLMRL